MSRVGIIEDRLIAIWAKMPEEAELSAEALEEEDYEDQFGLFEDAPWENENQDFHNDEDLLEEVFLTSGGSFGIKTYHYSADGKVYVAPHFEPETLMAFVENSDHLKDNTPLKMFCTKIHKDFKSGLSDITSYCYDFNDKDSSVNLKYPYKMKLVISDL